MSVFLTILTIIGIVILCVIALILFIISLLLFWPVKYKVIGKYKEKNYNIQIKVTWLLGFISFLSYFKNDKSDSKVKIAGMQLGGEKPARRKKKKEESDFKKTDNKDYKEYYKEESKEESKERIKEEVKEKTKEELKEKNKGIKKKERKEKKKEKKRKDKNEIKEKLKLIIEILKDEDFKEALKFLKRKIFTLIPKLLPKKMKGYLKIGFEDPAHTGQSLAIIAIIMGISNQYIKVEADFEKKILEANGEVRGRIFIFNLLWTAFTIYRNKSIKRVYKKFKELQI